MILHTILLHNCHSRFVPLHCFPPKIGLNDNFKFVILKVFGSLWMHQLMLSFNISLCLEWQIYTKSIPLRWVIATTTPKANSLATPGTATCPLSPVWPRPIDTHWYQSTNRNALPVHTPLEIKIYKICELLILSLLVSKVLFLLGWLTVKIYYLKHENLLNSSKQVSEWI